METLFSANSAPEFYCENCDIKCIKKNDWARHIKTRKHLRKNGTSAELLDSANDLTCKCQKKYVTKSGLWKHRKVCTYVKPTPYLKEGYHSKKCNPEPTKEEMIDTLLTENKDFKNIILELVKTNTDVQKQMVELCKNLQKNTKEN
jgi:hypothetical protein